jgi:hypothetical protein
MIGAMSREHPPRFPGRRTGDRIRLRSRACGWTAAAVIACTLTGTQDVSGQEIRGRVVDSVNGAPVGLAVVIVLDSERRPLVMSAADADGYYRVALPGPGELYVVVERLGYFENETPLLSIASRGEYEVDIEMRPEPFRLDPLSVTVENEKLEDYLSLELGQHPATLPGYRSIQGLRLEEAKLKARDNSDLLRWLYIPVFHGRRVCIGTFGAPLPPRTSSERTNARAEGPDPEAQCGALYVDGYRCPNEHIEEIDMDRIAVVVTLGSAVRLYTRRFDWTFRPGGGAPAC